MITLHSESAMTYKVKNIHANDGTRDLFFFSNPPHLLKTVMQKLLGIQVSISTGK